jgi:cytochrome c553
MTNGNRPSPNDSRFAMWIWTTAGIFIVALAVGFVWLPSTQRGAEGLDLWRAICRAVGLPSGNVEVARPIAGQPASMVAWTTQTRRNLAKGDSNAGARLAAKTCNPCHGDNGLSTDAAIPNLAGQSAAAVYKQLEDFRSGKRDAAVMGVYVSPLSQQDLLDLAAHYASLPNPVGDALSTQSSSNTVVGGGVEVGGPRGGRGPCGAGH